MNQGPRSSAHSMLQMFLKAAQGNQGSRPTAFANGGSVGSPYRTDGYNPYSGPAFFVDPLKGNVLTALEKSATVGEGADGTGPSGPGTTGAGGTVGDIGLGLMGYSELGIAPGAMVAGMIGPAMADMAIDQEAATDQAIANAIATNAISSVDVGPMGTTASVGAPGSAVSGAANEASHDADGNNASGPDGTAGVGDEGGHGADGNNSGTDSTSDSDSSDYARGGLVRRYAEGGEAEPAEPPPPASVAEFMAGVRSGYSDEKVTENMNEFIARKLDQYKNGYISLDELSRYLPGVDPYDLASMYGGTDSSLGNRSGGDPDQRKMPLRPPLTPLDPDMQLPEGWDALVREQGFPMDNAPTNRMKGLGPLEIPEPDQYYKPRIGEQPLNMPLTLAKGGEATDQGSRDTQQFVERKMVTMGLPKETFDPMFSAAVPDYDIDLRRGTGNAGVAPYQDPGLVRDADPELLKRSPATLSHEFEHQLAGKAALRYAGLPAEKNASQAAKNYVALRKMEREDPARAAELNAMMAVSPPVYFMQENMQKRGLSEAEAKQAFKDLRDEFGDSRLAKYLIEKFPEQKELGRIGRPGQPLHEYFADLSGLETRFRTDLTKDPYIRRYVFGNDDKLIQDYKAVTGLRQERLDAKDLPPYTPQYNESKAQGMLDWIKSKVRRRADGSPESGEVSPEDPFFGDAMMQSTVGTLPADRSIEEPSMARKGLDLLKQAGQTAYGNVKEAITDPVAFNKRALGNLAKQLRENPEEFMMNFTGGGLGGVIKPRGGNWSKQAVEDALGSMRQRLDRYVSVDIPGLEKFGAVTKTTPAEYAQALEKGLSDLEAGVDPMKVFSQTIHSDAEGILRGTPKEDLGPYVKRRITDELNDLVWPRVALDDWIQKNLGRYVTRDMATPEDPLRKLIDQNIAVAEERRAIGQRQIAKLEADIAKAKAAGKNTGVSEARLADLKFETQDAYDRALEAPLPGGIPSADFLWGIDEKISKRRIEGGFPEEGLAKSEAAKQYEKWADSVIDPINNPREFGAENPLIKNSFSPEEIERIMQGNQPVYELRDSMVLYEKPFQHLIDELKNATGTGSGLPKELQLTAADLQQMGIEKAFRHVQRIDDWRYAQKSQASLEKAGRSVELVKSYPDSPKSLRWVEIKKVGEGTEAEQKLADALKYEGSTMGHCVGGYCPDVLAGKSRIYSLRDARGEPHVTIEAAPSEMFTSDVYSFMVENPNLMDRLGINPEDYQYVANRASYFDQNEFTKELVKTPEYQEWLASRPMEILQIKGKGNMKPNKDYIPFVQDFVSSQKWSRIGDIENTELVPLRATIYADAQAMSRTVDPSFAPQVLFEAGGQRYVTKQEFNRLADMFGGINKVK